MRSLLTLLLLALLCPVSVHAASHLLAWTYTLTPADTSWRVERCVNAPPPANCAMQFVTNLPRTSTQYLDKGLPKAAYCYRVKTTTSAYSNLACTP